MPGHEIGSASQRGPEIKKGYLEIRFKSEKRKSKQRFEH
jgi:hypothetical protein